MVLDVVERLAVFVRFADGEQQILKDFSNDKTGLQKAIRFRRKRVKSTRLKHWIETVEIEENEHERK